MQLLFFLGSRYFEKKGWRLDEQSGLFFLCIIAIYILIFISFILLIRFIIRNYKNRLNLILAIILNIHVIVIIVNYFYDIYS